MSAIFRRAMSRFTIANLPRVEPAALAEQLLAIQTPDNSIAIVDVRDDDHHGGHIKQSKHIPSGEFDAWLPTLLRQLQHTKTVVFHCYLSQQRGPSAALKYIRAREGKFGTNSVQAPESTGDNSTQSYEAQTTTTTTTTTSTDGAPVVQKVCVLRGGFQAWGKAYGLNDQLTEEYDKDLWEVSSEDD